MHEQLTDEGVPLKSDRRERLRGAKILFVLPSLGFGGAERQAFLLGRHLVARRKARVKFVAFGPSGGLAALCSDAGIATAEFEMRHRYRSRTGQLRDVARFIGFLRREAADVVLPYCMFQNVLCGLTWRLGGARLCIWNQRDEGRSRLEPWAEHLAVRQTRSFISNSTHGAEFLIHTLGVRPEFVHVVRNGIELQPAVLNPEDWRRQLALTDKAFVACMIANLHGFKDHATLIMAWRKVVDQLAVNALTAHLLLAGDRGDRFDAIVHQVGQLGLAQRVHVLGPIEDITGLLRAADLCVFSSTTEGIPNGVLEAMASGLSVVATDCRGIREAVGPAGLECLATPADPDDLAEKIVRFALDPELRARLGKQARGRIETEFGLERMCEGMVSVMLRE